MKRGSILKQKKYVPNYKVFIKKQTDYCLIGCVFYCHFSASLVVCPSDQGPHTARGDGWGQLLSQTKYYKTS